MPIKLYPKYNNINEIPNSLTQSGIKVIDKYIVTSPKPIISMEMINNNHIKIIFNISLIYTITYVQQNGTFQYRHTKAYMPNTKLLFPFQYYSTFEGYVQ